MRTRTLFRLTTIFLAALLVVAMLHIQACGGGHEIARVYAAPVSDLSGRSDATVTYDTHGVTVSLGVFAFDPCPVLDHATATLNGVMMDVVTPGDVASTFVPASTSCSRESTPAHTDYACVSPSWHLESAPSDPLDIHIADASGSIDIRVESLTLAPSVSLDDTTLRIGARALIRMNPVPEVHDATLVFPRWFLVDKSIERTTDGFAFVVPAPLSSIVDAGLEGGADSGDAGIAVPSCSDDLEALPCTGALVLTVGVGSWAPSVTKCQGVATCAAENAVAPLGFQFAATYAP